MGLREQVVPSVKIDDTADLQLRDRQTDRQTHSCVCNPRCSQLDGTKIGIPETSVNREMDVKLSFTNKAKFSQSTLRVSFKFIIST